MASLASLSDDRLVEKPSSGRELRSLLLSLSYDILKGPDEGDFDQNVFNRFVLNVWPDMATAVLRKGWEQADSEKDGKLSRREFINWLAHAKNNRRAVCQTAATIDKKINEEMARSQVCQTAATSNKKGNEEMAQQTRAADGKSNYAFSRETTAASDDESPRAQAASCAEVGPPTRIDAELCLFAMWDRDKNGHISLEEVLDTCSKRSVTSVKRLRELFQAMDFNGDGHVSYDEFLCFLLPAPPEDAMTLAEKGKTDEAAA